MKLNDGDIVITTMRGMFPGVIPVAVGQGALFLTRRWWRMASSWRSWWHFRHVAMVVDDGASLCQAMPRGVEIVPLPEDLLTTPGTIIVRPAYACTLDASRRWLWEGERAAQAAKFYEDTPYGFLTYLKLSAAILRMPALEAWLHGLISTRRDMICSQHIDQALADAGYHVFDDGRIPQDVTPAELGTGLLNRHGRHLVTGPHAPTWVSNNARYGAKI